MARAQVRLDELVGYFDALEDPRSAVNLALAGCGVKGGQVIGATDKLGTEVAERPVTVPDLFCTFCRALKIDPRKENQSNVGRSLKIVEDGHAVKELFGA